VIQSKKTRRRIDDPQCILQQKFHPTLVKKNQSGQAYVAIDDYINRLNNVLGHAWAWQINDWKLYPDAAPPDTKQG
jgi:hypothetical protein